MRSSLLTPGAVGVGMSPAAVRGAAARWRWGHGGGRGDTALSQPREIPHGKGTAPRFQPQQRARAQAAAPRCSRKAGGQL